MAHDQPFMPALPPTPPSAAAPALTPAAPRSARKSSFAWRIFAWWSSASAAAVQIAALAVVVATGAVYESTYGPEAARVAVYQSSWFAVEFALLAVTIAGAAAVRWPWRRHQYGFVVVHAGLLMLIFGFALAGNHRLDGQLAVLPGKEAAVMVLPEDEIIVDDGLHRHAARFQPADDAGYPSCARFLVSSLWPVPPPGVHHLDAPRLLMDGATDGGISVELLAVADTAAADLGWEASSDDGAPAAAKLDLSVRTPMMPSGNFQDIGTSWLAQDGDPVAEVGPLIAGLATASDPQLIADFLAGPKVDLSVTTASATAPSTASTRGQVLVYWHGERHDVPLPDTLPADIELSPDLALRVQSYVANPRVVGGKMVQADDALADPFVQAAVGTGPAATRTWHDVTLAALHPLPQAGPNLPEARFVDPTFFIGDSGTNRQGWLQMLAGPDGQLHVAWLTRTHGWGGSTTIAPGATWAGDIVGDTRSAMELQTHIEWLPHARQGPQTLDMQPDQHDKATRWIQVRITRDGHAGAAWIARGTKEAVHLDDGSAVPCGYDHATYDLRRERGFSLRLDRFDAGQDPGGEHAASYRSDVTVVPIDEKTRAAMSASIIDEQAARDRMFADSTLGRFVPSALAHWLRAPHVPPVVAPGPALVTMNQPLELAGVSIYQASYFQETDDNNQPTGRLGSVFTVARDPGRPYKYLGSVLLVAGILLLYFLRPSAKRRAVSAPSPAASGTSA